LANLDPERGVADQAAVWAARGAYGEMTEQDCGELEAWLADDRRHRGAYLRAQAAVIAMETAVAQGPAVVASDNDNDSGTAAPGRRFRWAAIAASVAVLMAVATPVWRMLDPVAASHHERMMLSDGSSADLDADARIAVVMSAQKRQITLLKGKATFHVAKDTARPFIVRSGDVYAQATGTIYSVTRLGSSGGTINVKEGKVLVWAGETRDRAVLLHAGGALSLDPGKSGLASAMKQETPAAPSGNDQISFDDVSIAIAVQRFNRLQSVKRLEVDPALAEIKLVGLFRADDPEQFAKAAAAVSGGKVEHAGNRLVIKER
jgi:transmembrane sensor